MEHNAEFRAGDLIYFLTPDHKTVDWGICCETFCDGYGVELYELPDFRTVCGTPIKSFQFNHPRKKLPKDWTWQTDLCCVRYDTEEATKEKYHGIHIHDPQSIRTAISNGALVHPSSQDASCTIDADITKEGYTIVCKHPYWTKSRPDFQCIRRDNCYHSFQDAKAEADKYIQELRRQAELSDYDWSVEQIDHTLAMWQGITGASSEDVQKARMWLLAQKDVENLVVRIFSGHLQFKWDRQRRWFSMQV